MPIYDYACDECGEASELMILDATPPQCSKCGSQSLKKLMSAPAPRGRSKALIRNARAQAAREGHLSNYSTSERQRS